MGIEYRDYITLSDGEKVIGKDGAIYAHIASSALEATQPIIENIYSGTATGSTITEGGLEDYTYFQFQVIGVDADDDVNISISLDGINFVGIPLVRISTGAVVAASANVEAEDIYRYGTQATAATLEQAVVLGVKAIKVTRATATGSNQVDVIMRAS